MRAEDDEDDEQGDVDDDYLYDFNPRECFFFKIDGLCGQFTNNSLC